MAEASRSSAPGVHQLNVLVRMISSTDEVERDVGGRAIRDLDPGRITEVLSDPGLTPETLEFFTHQSGSRADWVAALLANPKLPEPLRALLAGPGTQAAERGAEDGQARETDGLSGEPPSEGAQDDRELTLAQRIGKMGVGEKVKSAMKGDKETRAILIKDTNREVYMSVLNNPGIKESEIEMLTKNTGTNTDILRVIGKNREWMANANIMKNLIMNTKTPVELSIRFLPRLSKKDLEFIEKSRNLPSALRSTAKRLLGGKKNA